jgi:GTP-binding protein
MSVAENTNLRNVAIIAHVDHGKTTLVDHLLKQSGTVKSDSSDRVMDQLELERERGITIAAKNAAVWWKGTKINILDTPGHADFGGEVERALRMVDGAILLVDASEGPLPQTRFVLRKALEARLKIIVVINKIDRADARPQEVLSEIYDLFIDLDATDDQIEFPVLYAIGKEGIASTSLEERGTDLTQLFDTILTEIPAPVFAADEPFQMLVLNLGYSDYLGRLAIGRVYHGKIKVQGVLGCIGEDGKVRQIKVSSVQGYKGMGFVELPVAEAGDIIIVAGVDDVSIGDTLCEIQNPKALPRVTVDEPTISMMFAVNASPFAGRDGKFVQSRKILERLEKEALHNVGIRLNAEKNSDAFIVQGRGEFQMAILIETMRREGYELTIGRPQILFKTDEAGEKLEPVEHVFIDCEEQYTGVVTEKLSFRKGRMLNLVNHGTGRVRLEFSVPSRGLLGLRNEFLTDTRGTGIMNAYLEGFEPYRGDFPTRKSGSLIADRQGEAIPYAIFHLEPRGIIFVQPNDPVYEGMIVGEHNRENDLDVNICREKKLSNMRAAGKDENILLTPVISMTLEKAIEFIRDDECVEVTPKAVRIRKMVLQANKR